MYYVYVYKDPINLQPFYVGKGTKNRKNRHLTEKKERTKNYLKWCKIQSLKNKNLTPIIDIVFETLDEEEAYKKEKELISFYGRKFLDEHGILTNRTKDRFPPFDYAPKLPRNETYLNNMSEAKKGNKNPMYGQVPWNKGKPHALQTKDKISEANLGRKYSKEEHEKRNKTRGKKYLVIDPNGKKTVVKNLKRFCRENNLCQTNLRLALVGYRGKISYKGYTGKKLS